MGQHDVGHGVIWPLIFDRLVDLRERRHPNPAGRRRRGLLIGLVGRHARATGIHGNRGIAALRSKVGPNAA